MKQNPGTWSIFSLLSKAKSVTIVVWLLYREITDGVAHSDSQVKANILSNQFSSVITKEDTSTIPSLGHSTHPDLARITVSEDGVQKLLGGLKIYSAAGPDEIPARLLKEYASELAPALTLIFPASLDQSALPATWKHAWVIPVSKKGERARPSNYRPILLTCIACKCLEHSIHSNIMDQLDNRFPARVPQKKDHATPNWYRLSMT